MSVSLHRIRIALKLPESVPPLLVKARAIVDAMTGNPWFPSPSPPLAKVSAAIDALDAAHTVTLSRTRGTVSPRNDKRAALVVLLNRIGSYVEGIAEDNPEHAGAIIEGAGLDQRKPETRVKPPFAVKPGPVEGSVKATAKAPAKTTGYEWQWREDGAAEWTEPKRTIQAKAEIRGLTPGKKYWFRIRFTLRSGTTDWSEAVAMIVR